MGRPGRKHDRLREGSLAFEETSRIKGSSIDNKFEKELTPELYYTSEVSLSHRRRHAQFFTPNKIANLMAEWAVTRTTETMLEPAVGTGVLIRAAFSRKADLRVTAFERDPIILRAFLSLQPDLCKVEVFLADFLTREISSIYDAVLMNPPYLRHHDLNYDFDIFSSFGRKYDLKISRLSNAYLLFTLKACMALKPGGRASIIIPTEWMNANFGAAMKSFLVSRDFLREIIYFSGCSEIFDDALTTASVLFIERPS